MATLPDFLYGSYKRYEADTHSLVRWLVQAAQKCGHHACATLQQPSNGCQAQKSKKSKERTGPARQQVSLEELSALAHTIVQSGIEVPPIIIARTKRAIATRKGCANLFSSKTSGCSGLDLHSSFITAFEDLCELLEQLMPRKSSNIDPPMLMVDDFANAESYILQDDQCVNSRHDEVMTDLTKAPDGNIEIKVAGPDSVNAPLQMLFHAFCLFEDLKNMRKLVSESVQEYAAGKIDLANVAVVADIAVRLATQLIEEVTATWPRLGEPGSIQHLVYIIACGSRGESIMARPDPFMPYNINMEDIAGWCYLPATTVLATCKELLQLDQLDVSGHVHCGAYNPNACRDRMSARTKLDEDVIILHELLPEFALVATCDIDLPANDEITNALVAFTKTEDITLSLSFATQILLDVHHGLRHIRSKAYSDLTLTGLRISKALQEYWNISRSLTDRPRYWPEKSDEYVQNLQKAIETWIVDDVFTNARRSGHPRASRREAGMEKHLLLRSHAILCGLTMYHFTLRMHYVSVVLVNQWQGVPQMAYVYSIVQRTGLKGLSWPDVDAFVDMHGRDHSFTSWRRSTAGGSTKELCLTKPVRSPSDSTFGDRQRSGDWAQNPDSRPEEPGMAAANMFQGWYLAKGPRKTSIESIDKLIEQVASDMCQASTATILLQPQASPSFAGAGAKAINSAFCNFSPRSSKACTTKSYNSNSTTLACTNAASSSSASFKLDSSEILDMISARIARLTMRPSPIFPTLSLQSRRDASKRASR